MEDGRRHSLLSFSHGICLNGVMSSFPTPIQLASGHHRQGKLEGNFHIKDEGLAGFKLSQVMQRKTGIWRQSSLLLLCCWVGLGQKKSAQNGSLHIGLHHLRVHSYHLINYALVNQINLLVLCIWQPKFLSSSTSVPSS